MADLWPRTQEPDQHVRWDLRFTGIVYLPRANDDEPQRFRYETRLGFGLRISGWGESRARIAEGVSDLVFGSDDAKSLIRQGSGCWVTHTRGDQVLFRTIYQYDVRYGWAGRWIDGLVFRPLMGWATAWSFDRLRLWLETGTPPEVIGRLALVHAAARGLLGFIWLWHGIVPKLLFPEAGELALLQQTGMFASHERTALVAVGVLEALVGVALLVWGRSRWLLGAVATALVAFTVQVALAQPQAYRAPINAFTFNVALLGLVLVAWLSERFAPRAARCRRKQEERHDIHL